MSESHDYKELVQEVDLVDPRVWESIEPKIKLQISILLSQDLLRNFAFTIAEHCKNAISQLDVSQSADEFRQQYAQLQFQMTFWTKLTVWPKQEKDKLAYLIQQVGQ